MAPPSQSVPPTIPAGALALHLTARYLDASGQVEKVRPDFHEVPAEDWLVLTPQECRQFIPPVGAPRPISAALAERLLTHLHPSDMSLEDDPNGRNWIQIADLKVTRLSRSYVRIDGRLAMRRSFTQVAESEARPIAARLTGYVELEAGGAGIRSLRLVTIDALYGSNNFGVAIREGR